MMDFLGFSTLFVNNCTGGSGGAVGREVCSGTSRAAACGTSFLAGADWLSWVRSC